MAQNKSFWLIHTKNCGIWDYQYQIAAFDHAVPGMIRLFDHNGVLIAVWNISEISHMEYVVRSNKKEAEVITKETDACCTDEEKARYTLKSPFDFQPCTPPDPSCWTCCVPMDVTAPPQQWIPHNPNPEPVPEFQFQEDYLEWAMDNDPDFIKEVTDDE